MNTVNNRFASILSMTWWVLTLRGVLAIIFGVLTWREPELSVTLLIVFFGAYIAIWAIATGVLQILAGIRLRKQIQGEWLLVLGGLASVVFGVFLMAQPVAGALTMAWLIALYAVVFGVVLVFLALRVRAFGQHMARTE